MNKLILIINLMRFCKDKRVRKVVHQQDKKAKNILIENILM